MLMLFSWMIYTEKIVSELMTGMEWLEEYVEEESPYTEQDHLQREPIQEDITTNSSEFLQTIKN